MNTNHDSTQNRMQTRSFSKKCSTTDSCYNKIITNERPANIISILNQSQISGRPPRSVTHLPTKLIDTFSERLPAADYLHLLKKLDELSVFICYQDIQDALELVNVFKDIETRLVHFRPNISALNESFEAPDEFEVHIINIESANAFRNYGGIEILKRIILSNSTTNEESNFEKLLNPELKIKCKCIKILNRLICQPNYGKALAQDLLRDGDMLLQYLFFLLLNVHLRSQVCSLIESILLHIPLFNLNSIKDLRLIIQKIDDNGLAFLCKIFAVTLSDLDSSDYKSWNSAQRKPKITHPEGPQTRDSNHELILSIPRLLHRLVNLVKRKDYTTRYSNTQAETEQWIRLIDELLSDDELHDDNLNNSSNDSFTNSRNQIDSVLSDDIFMQPSLASSEKINNYVLVLYTLSLLLVGKERKSVQKQLAKLGLASALNSLFDFLIWNCRCEYPQDNGPNPNRSHLCPEVAVKIQLLRLIHSFCDNSDYKRSILSKSELTEILKYNQEAIPSLQCKEGVLLFESKRSTKGDKGLLSKIVDVIKQEPFSASFRFWLTRAIESYLRGSTSYADQLFLIKRGIVEDTTRNIIDINTGRPKEVTQSCFDMLGELIKFNTCGFTILSNELNETQKFDTFIRIINNSLVDSNMFLRSIFLSIDFFINQVSELNFDIATNRILSHFDDFEKRVHYICRMINIITIHNLSQENVSCLNTTLVILMLANKKDQLPKYLRSIKNKSSEIATSANNDLTRLQNALINFKDLLVFWQTHYLQKDKDCVGLEQNSKIPFKYWKETVELLLSSDAANPCSLSHYLDSTDAYVPKTNQIDELRSD